MSDEIIDSISLIGKHFDLEPVDVANIVDHVDLVIDMCKEEPMETKDFIIAIFPPDKFSAETRFRAFYLWATGIKMNIDGKQNEWDENENDSFLVSEEDGEPI